MYFCFLLSKMITLNYAKLHTVNVPEQSENIVYAEMFLYVIALQNISVSTAQ